MKLSTRSRYGLKAVVDLALCYGEGPVTLPYLAAQQGISEAYLEQLLRSLKKSGVVETLRGAQGGYVLGRAPEDISVQEVMRVLEGSTALADCVGTEAHDCENACSCSARPLFLKLQARINEVLRSTTVRDLAEDFILQKRRLEDAKGLS
ncbi:MAG: Rrf2 family transcriptional regulator [Clostridia bacterium]|nr:Rrf2 family transcriptional regulator [Clostridia bacterium]